MMKSQCALFHVYLKDPSNGLHLLTLRHIRQEKLNLLVLFIKIKAVFDNIPSKM